MQEETTHIRITTKFKEWLDARKKPGRESYENTIKRLLRVK